MHGPDSRGWRRVGPHVLRPLRRLGGGDPRRGSLRGGRRRGQHHPRLSPPRRRPARVLPRFVPVPRSGSGESRGRPRGRGPARRLDLLDHFARTQSQGRGQPRSPALLRRRRIRPRRPGAARSGRNALQTPARRLACRSATRTLQLGRRRTVGAQDPRRAEHRGSDRHARRASLDRLPQPRSGRPGSARSDAESGRGHRRPSRPIGRSHPPAPRRSGHPQHHPLARRLSDRRRLDRR